MRTFNEAEEAFGAPPPSAQIATIVKHLWAVNHSPDPMAALQECLRLADEFQGDAYSAVLGPALGVAAPGAEFEAVTEFFHSAAAYGEARMLTRILESVMNHAVLQQETAGNA